MIYGLGEPSPLVKESQIPTTILRVIIIDKNAIIVQVMLLGMTKSGRTLGVNLLIGQNFKIERSD